MKSGPVICFGEVLWDMLPDGPKPGGASLNVAIHLKQHGQNPVLISKIGNDSEGTDLLAFLNQSKINTNYIEIDSGLPTSKVIIHLDKNKNATYEICNPVAWDNIQDERIKENMFSEASLIIFGSLASRNSTTRETLFKILDQSNALHLCDVNLRPPYDKKEIVEDLIKQSDFIKLNDDELNVISGWYSFKGNEKEKIRWMSNYYKCPSVCVTRGENGAVLYYNNKFYEHAGFKVDAIDTVGAGDAFLASLLSGLMANIHPENALEQACATGAFVASKMGAVPVYSIEEINEIINSKNK